MMLDWLTAQGYKVHFKRGGETAYRDGGETTAPTLRGLCELLGWES